MLSFKQIALKNDYPRSFYHLSFLDTSQYNDTEKFSWSESQTRIVGVKIQCAGHLSTTTA